LIIKAQSRSATFKPGQSAARGARDLAGSSSECSKARYSNFGIATYVGIALEPAIGEGVLLWMLRPNRILTEALKRANGLWIDINSRFHGGIPVLVTRIDAIVISVDEIIQTNKVCPCTLFGEVFFSEGRATHVLRRTARYWFEKHQIPEKLLLLSLS